VSRLLTNNHTATLYHSLCVLQADVILAVTCAIRENAESKIWNRLDYFKSLKKKRSNLRPPLKIGVLGMVFDSLHKSLVLVGVSRLCVALQAVWQSA